MRTELRVIQARGGGYINGSMAQEEALCTESDLYNILSAFDGTYYEPHRRNTGSDGLYTSELLYTPDVIFERDGKTRKCSVITCAAPNAGVAESRGVSAERIKAAMTERMELILDTAAENGMKVLILGAYGCGVFGNDAGFVAREWKRLLTGNFRGAFEEAVFAVPDERNFAPFRNL